MRPRLLDLFCGAGGAAVGYHRAGFDVVGVDIRPQPRYPFEFHQADAMSLRIEASECDGVPARFADGKWLGGGRFDAIHASPPCQAYSVTKNAHAKKHPELLEPTRAMLEASGVPYVIENVMGAPLHGIVLCGTMFGLTTTDEDGATLWLKRHRLFELGGWFTLAPECMCAEYAAAPNHRCGGVYGGGSTDHVYAREVRCGGYTPSKERRAALMGVPSWHAMTLHELSQAIPPAYTEWIGERLMAHVQHPTPSAGGR